MAEAKPKPKLPKRTTKGTPITMIEYQLVQLNEILIGLLRLGYRPMKIDIPQCWRYEEDGTYNFVAYIVIDTTNWNRAQMDQWVKHCVKNDWNFVLTSHMGSERIDCKVFVRNANK